MALGARIKRKEDPRLLTGTATYTDDIQLPGMLFAHFVRSPYAHAHIKSIDTSKARGAHGVAGVYTAADLKAGWAGPLPCAWAAYPNLRATERWPLAVDTVRHVGEPVAVVVADSAAAAADAADLVDVQYDALPAVVDTEAALQPGATKLHSNLADNTAFTFDYASAGVSDAFKGADRVIKHRLWQQRLVPNAMEPRAYLAQFHKHTGELTLWSSTQAPHFIRLFVGLLLGVPEHLFRVVAPEVGGGFGSKLQVYNEELLVCQLAMKLNRPVKYTMERREEFLSTHHGREGFVDVEAAVKHDGTVVAWKFNWVSDMGAYNMLNGPYVPILGFLVLPGPYKAKEIEVHLQGVFTNKMGTDAYRGAGRPEATHMLERTMDRIALDLNLDPLVVRERNLIQPDQFPFTTAVGLTYDSGDYQASLRKALEMVDYKQLRTEQAKRRKQGGKQIGIGLSTYIEACGLAPSAATSSTAYAASLYESAEVRVHHTGKVTVFTGSSSHGQGHETAWAQIVSESLGVPMDDVDVVHGDTNRGPLGFGTYGSRSLVVGGTALVKALDKVKEKARHIAAHKLEVAPEDIEFAQGKLFVKGALEGRSLAFAEIAAAANFGFHAGMPPGMEPGLDAIYNFSPDNFSYPGGTHICVTEVDIETGKVEILQYVAVDDIGNVINPLIAEGQVHGGIAQGIAQALFEELRYDEAGQPQGASLMDYAIPTAADLPTYRTDFTCTPATTNPLGAKGVGEAGTIASTPAVINAVVDAISHLGVKDIDMPATPPRVWRAIQLAKGGH